MIALTTSTLSPRKRPQQRRAKATCDALMEAAAQVIARYGLAGFNTNAVAARAGVSIGSLYQYFPNKDALMVALIQRQQAQQAETFAAAVAALQNADLTSVVHSLVRAAMQHHRDDSLLASAIDHEEARLPVGDTVDGYLAQSGMQLAPLFARHPEIAASINFEHAARTLPALVRATVDAWANLTPPQLDVAEDEAVRAVLGYLTREPATSLATQRNGA